jgi:hypothetical protein
MPVTASSRSRIPRGAGLVSEASFLKGLSKLSSLAAVAVVGLCGPLAVAATPAFSDGFENHAVGKAPGTPWKEESYDTGVLIRVDEARAFSGSRALHVTAPRGAKYRRGYVAIHLGGPLPQLQSGFHGRAMVWLDAAPRALPGAPPVHWTLLQGEGRSADDRYNSIYRLGLEERDGTQWMANFETTPPVTTDCKRQSKLRLPVKRWACVEWRFDVASDSLEFWLDGKRITRVAGRAGASACRGDDLAGEWRAPPRFDSLYIGLERYADSANDQDLWIDDVELSTRRVGCPKSKGGDR